MNFALSAEQEMLRDTFARLFAREVPLSQVRQAETRGLDPAVWARLADSGLFGLRLTGEGGSLLDAAVVAEEVGRALIPGPVLETVVAVRLLGQLGGAEADRLAEDVVAGTRLVTFALADFARQPTQLIAGGASTSLLIARHGEDVCLLRRAEPPARLIDLGGGDVGRWTHGESGQEVVPLGSGPVAVAAFAAAVEEWKLLLASALVGLADQALKLAAAYAVERIQFGRPIGSFQAIAHPLADSLVDVEAARLLVWRTAWSIARGRAEAGATLSGAFWWASRSATRAVARALHSFGGYGLSLEYDIQLYHRRAKAWPLILGDPDRELARSARRRWTGEVSHLPDAGEIDLEFDFDADAQALRREGREFFARTLTPALRAHAHHSWEGHHPDVQRALAAAGLLFPDWPAEHGGRGSSPYAVAALAAAFHAEPWTRHAIQVTNMVARTVMLFGSDSLKAEVLPRIAAGDAIASLGFTEPGSGSDVFAAKTRSTRQADGDWLIDGQKIFTSGADIAQYVLLLTRSDPAAVKHHGLTMFLVPLDSPGIEVQAVHTLSDERTNITFYTSVPVPDRYRLGEVGGGAAVIGAALAMEHSDTGYPLDHARLLATALRWAREHRIDGRPALEDPLVAQRLARTAVHNEAADMIARRALWSGAEGKGNRVHGPMAKLFATEIYVQDAADLVDLAAPLSILRSQPDNRTIELDYRHSTATTVYGGTSEIMRSLIAENGLGLPRTRS